jgi:hypothetical protein
LLQIVESGPIPAVHGVVRTRLIDLAQRVLLKEIGFVVQHCCYVGGFKYQSFPEDPV